MRGRTLRRILTSRVICNFYDYNLPYNHARTFQRWGFLFLNFSWTKWGFWFQRWISLCTWKMRFFVSDDVFLLKLGFLFLFQPLDCSSEGADPTRRYDVFWFKWCISLEMMFFVSISAVNLAAGRLLLGRRWVDSNRHSLSWMIIIPKAGQKEKLTTDFHFLKDEVFDSTNVFSSLMMRYMFHWSWIELNMLKKPYIET